MLAFASSAMATETVRIAAASNLVFVMDALQAAFRTESSNIKLEVVFGSSGNLVAQITHGAPYDIFLSADMEYPKALINSGLADADSLIAFAGGRLALWTRRDNLNLTDIKAALQDPTIRKLAIANITAAPYGRAARQTLESLGLWNELQSKLVLGENISQTAQFIDSGNADAGLVALSLVLSPTLSNRGHWFEVPEELHESLTQGAVLTTRGTTNSSARAFLTYILGDEARKIFARHGYGVPASI